MAHYFVHDTGEVTRVIYLDSVDPSILIGSKTTESVPDPEKIDGKLPVLMEGPDGLYYKYVDFTLPDPVEPPLTPLTPSEYEVLKQENTELRARIVQTERISAENALSNQELLELLIEMGVI